MHVSLLSLFGQKAGTGWRRPMGCLTLQVIFRKRATNYRARLRKMTYKDKASCGSWPLCCRCGVRYLDSIKHQVACRVCCSALQCVAVCCSVLPWGAQVWSILNTKRHARTGRDVRDLDMDQLSRMTRGPKQRQINGGTYSVLQCGAVCCSVLQCVAMCCSVLQWVSG